MRHFVIVLFSVVGLSVSGCLVDSNNQPLAKPLGPDFDLDNCTVISSVAWLPGEKEDIIPGWDVGIGIAEPVLEFGICEKIHTPEKVFFNASFGWLKGNEQSPHEQCLEHMSGNTRILKWMIVDHDEIREALEVHGIPVIKGEIELLVELESSPSATISWTPRAEKFSVENLLPAVPTEEFSSTRELVWAMPDGLGYMRQEVAALRGVDSYNFMRGEFSEPAGASQGTDTWIGSSEFHLEYDQTTNIAQFDSTSCDSGPLGQHPF